MHLLYSYRCKFHGTASELASHLEAQCPFESMKDFLRRTESKISELQASLQQKNQDIDFLRSMMGKLSSRVDAIEKTSEDRIGKNKILLPPGSEQHEVLLFGSI